VDAVVGAERSLASQAGEDTSGVAWAVRGGIARDGLSGIERSSLIL
jgi:hypothetical protein